MNSIIIVFVHNLLKKGVGQKALSPEQLERIMRRMGIDRLRIIRSSGRRDCLLAHVCEINIRINRRGLELFPSPRSY